MLGKLPLVVCAGDVVSDHLHSLVPCLLVVLHIWYTFSVSLLLFKSETRKIPCTASESAIKLAERRAGSRIHLTDEKCLHWSTTHYHVGYCEYFKHIEFDTL